MQLARQGQEAERQAKAEAARQFLQDLIVDPYSAGYRFGMDLFGGTNNYGNLTSE